MDQMKKEITKDHELLIRIDERLTQLIDRLVKVEMLITAHSEQSHENRLRLDKIEIDLYGKNNVEGLIKKVEEHDKIIVKAVAYFGVTAVILEFIFKYFIK